MENETPKLNLFERRSTFVALLGLLVASLSLSLILYADRGNRIPETTKVIAAVSIDDPFKDIKLSAKGAFVWDVNNKKPIFTLEPDKSLPLASITKIMMAITAADLVPSYTVIDIRPEFLVEEGDTGLFADEKWKLADLINFSLIVSSNDAARAIASAVGSIARGGNDMEIGRKEFIKKMNDKALSLGLTQTKFFNESGLDTVNALPGAYGSPRDVAVLFEYLIHNFPEVLEATKQSKYTIRSLSKIDHTVANTNGDVNIVPGLIASKTGYTKLAGGNLVIAFDPYVGRPIIISVLGSTFDGRFEDVNKLVAATMKYMGQGN